MRALRPLVIALVLIVVLDLLLGLPLARRAPRDVRIPRIGTQGLEEQADAMSVDDAVSIAVIGDSVVQGLAGVLLGGGIFFLLFLVGGMGAGDVKLMAAVSAWVGVRHAPLMLVATALAGGALALLYVLPQKRFRQTAANIWRILRLHFIFGIRPVAEVNARQTSARLPYGMAIACGTLYLLFTTSNIRG